MENGTSEFYSDNKNNNFFCKPRFPPPKNQQKITHNYY